MHPQTCKSMSRVSVHQFYIPNDGLMECLRTVGVTSGPLSLQQIMDSLKDYIMERRLFDPTCPTRILCGQDPLGKVLGVERFLVSEVIGLLVKQIRAVPTQHVVSQGALKRESQSGACEDSAAVEAKRPRLEPDSTTSGATSAAEHMSPVTICIPPSPSYDSGTETVYSVQGRETDFVKDTSDDLWFLEESGDCDSSSDSEATQQRIMQAAALAAELLRQQRRGGADDYSDQDSDCPFEVEYEIEEESDHGGKAGSISSDSDIEELAQAEILICVNDDDAQFWADSSDSYSSDSEIGDADLWQCRLCGLRCEPHGCLSAVQRYCTGCWKQRFGWLPDRTERHPPQKKRRRAQRRTSRQLSRAHADRDSSAKLESRHQLDSAGEESHPASCSDKNEASHLGTSNTESNSGGSQESFSDPSMLEMLPPHSNSSQAASSGPSQELADDWSQPGCSKDGRGEEGASSSGSASELCTICLVRPKCGILVHGRTSHRLSCYKCALQLQKRNQPCPVCRRRIQRVVRNFDA